MQSLHELNRHPSPATRPHPLAYLDGRIWIASWDTDHLYAIDPKAWTVVDDVAAPGKPYGLTAYGRELRVVVAHGEEDDRYLYRFVPGTGFDEASKTACPDFTGSYLTADGTTLYLGQMTNRRILALRGDGSTEREIPLPTRCGGFGVGPDGRFYMISGDEELEHLSFGTLDIQAPQPSFEAIAPLPDEARSLVHDGSRWWTCLRDTNELASFEM